MTPAQDNVVRQRAQGAYDFAVAELARTEEPEWYPEPGAGQTDWYARFEEGKRNRDAYHATAEYQQIRQYRSWLYDVRSFADYRRQNPIVRLLKRSQRIGRVACGEYGEPAPRFRWHWQNLSKEAAPRPHSPTILGLPVPDLSHDGRAWIDWYVREGDVRPFKAEVDWVFGRRVWSSGVSYQRRSSGSVMLHAAIRPLFSFYLTLKHLWPRADGEESRCYGISLVDDAIHYDLGKPGSGDEWHRSDPLNWMRGIIMPIDRIFGRFDYRTEKVGPEVDAVASFPEGSYPLKLQRETAYRKRPRWPFTHVSHYVDIKAERPAEAQGKGENSWDMDPDGIWAMSSPGHSYEDAVVAYVKATLRDRRRHGVVDDAHRTILTPTRGGDRERTRSDYCRPGL